MMHVTDWLPTLYSAAGGDIQNLSNLDGFDQWEALSDNSASRRHEILLNIDPVHKCEGIRVGDYKLVRGNMTPESLWKGWLPPWRYPGDGCEQSGHQYAFTVQCGIKSSNASTNCLPEISPCLYHIPTDPCEYNNIAGENPDIVQHLLDRIDFYRSSMIAPENIPADPKGNPIYHDGIWGPWIKL